MTALRERQLFSTRLPNWGGKVLGVVVAVLVGAPLVVIADAMWQIYRPPRLVKDQSQSPDAFMVKSFASASRERTCALVKYGDTGRETARIEFERGEPGFEQLILTLLPIRDEKTVAPRSTGYMVWVFVGNRGGPTINVGFTPDDHGDAELAVEYHGRYYSGGNAAEFKRIAESLLQASE